MQNYQVVIGWIIVLVDFVKTNVELVLDIVDAAKRAHVPVLICPASLHVSRLADAVTYVLGARSQELLLTDQQRGNWFYGGVRRGVDICFALGVWVGERRTSDGPGIFAQRWVERFGKNFTLYKFRSMVAGTKQVGSHELMAVYLTKIGGFCARPKLMSCRRFSIFSAVRSA